MYHSLAANGHNVTLIIPKKESQYNQDTVFNFYGVDSIFDIENLLYQLKEKLFFIRFMHYVDPVFIG